MTKKFVGAKVIHSPYSKELLYAFVACHPDRRGPVLGSSQNNKFLARAYLLVLIQRSILIMRDKKIRFQPTVEFVSL